MAAAVPTLFAFLVLLFLVEPQPSSSRPINGFHSAAGNIALPGDRGLAQSAPECGSRGSARASPLDSATPKPEMTTEKYREDGEIVPPPLRPATTKQQLLAEKYTPLLLNFLPRGQVPPSGPSPGINGNRT